MDSGQMQRSGNPIGVQVHNLESVALWADEALVGRGELTRIDPDAAVMAPPSSRRRDSPELIIVSSVLKLMAVYTSAADPGPDHRSGGDTIS